MGIAINQNATNKLPKVSVHYRDDQSLCDKHEQMLRIHFVSRPHFHDFSLAKLRFCLHLGNAFHMGKLILVQTFCKTEPRALT